MFKFKLISMISFSAYKRAGSNRHRFDPLIKKDTYAFLHFIPTKDSPENLRINISVYEMDNLIDERNYFLELDITKKSYQEHYIGVQQNGNTQRIVFTMLDYKNNSPLDNLCLQVAVVKIKDGDDDRDGGIKFKPKRPRAPALFGC